MKRRVQVLLDDEDRDRFTERASREGLSLSAWLREAGRLRLQQESKKLRFSGDELRFFFEECDRRESGREPDWTEHLRVIEESRSEGAPRG